MISATLKTAGRELDRVTDEFLPAFSSALKRRAMVSLLLDIERRSPVGTLDVTSPHPGKYRGSHTISRGPQPIADDLPDQGAFPIRGQPYAERAVGDPAMDEPVHMANAARTGRNPKSYAPALEAGHSPQAASGVYGPATDALSRRIGAIMERAAREAAREVRLG